MKTYRTGLIKTFFINQAVAATEPQWQKVYVSFIDETLNEIKGA